MFIRPAYISSFKYLIVILRHCGQSTPASSLKEKIMAAAVVTDLPISFATSTPGRLHP
jgi:hypothetical protein